MHGDVLRFRFTPTRVGTTLNSATGWGRISVHPHARGDDKKRVGIAKSCGGSPPRAWGRLQRLAELNGSVRFTPTRVGTTTSCGTSTTSSTVHPHARGDDATPRPPPPHYSGSPPRAWGRRYQARSRAPQSRFTPTRVGTTCWKQRHATLLPVHPHARGDDSMRPPRVPTRLGSPPRAWGRLSSPLEPGCTERFTPTRVGTTTTTAMWNAIPSVHPHARGDDAFVQRREASFRGSPPRAWGRRGHLHDRAGLIRFTPTRVGTTSGCRCSCCSWAVHPHARGDD